MKTGHWIGLSAFVLIAIGVGLYLISDAKKAFGSSSNSNSGDSDNTSGNTSTTTGSNTLPVDSGLIPPNVTPTLPDNSGSSGGSSVSAGMQFPIKKGDRNESVRKVQALINSRGSGAKLAEDGIFGANTEKAVIAFFGTSVVTESMWVSKNSDCSSISWMNPIDLWNCHMNS
jgi:hypothetical protein